MLTGFQRGTERLLPGPQDGADRVGEEEQLRQGVNRSRGRSDDTTTSAGDCAALRNRYTGAMTPVGTAPELADRILGGWLGRIAGNMLGKPVEQGDLWTRDRIDRYLRQAAALPLTDYLPEPVGESDGFELRPEWRECVRGRIHGSCRDDDVDYAILGLDLLETHGFGFSTEQVGDLWLLRLPYLQTFTAERAAYRNLANGLKPPLTATYDNPCQEWIGALIRADIYGWTCPGAPRRAAALARRDAVLSHTGNGVQNTVPLRDVGGRQVRQGRSSVQWAARTVSPCSARYWHCRSRIR